MSIKNISVPENKIYIPNQGWKTSLINNNSKDATEYGTYHMADRPDLFEPLRTNHFEFQVHGLKDKLDEMGDTIYASQYSSYNTNAKNPYDADEVLRLAVERASIPHFNQGDIPVKRGNSTLHFAGAPQFQGENIVIKDYVGTNAKNALMAWQNLSYNVKTEKIGLACNYKLNCILREYTPDYITVREWLLRGCWISGLQENPYASSDGDALQQITATITYDRGEIWDTSRGVSI